MCEDMDEKSWEMGVSSAEEEVNLEFMETTKEVGCSLSTRRRWRDKGEGDSEAKDASALGDVS